MTQDLLTVVLRLHSTTPEVLGQFDRALFSLAGSTHHPLEPLIVTQRFSAPQTREAEAVARRFLWPHGSTPRILNFDHPEDRDHRSALLNRGMDEARGRYLAFLDCDDYVYEHAYETLIARLRECRAAVAFGGCVAARESVSPDGERHVVAKSLDWADASDDAFLADNSHPIHSFVIDRERLGAPLPRFSEDLTRLEDFEFLLRLRMMTVFDRRCLHRPLVEYTRPEAGAAPSAQEAERWQSARARIAVLKTEVANFLGLPEPANSR